MDGTTGSGAGHSSGSATTILSFGCWRIFDYRTVAR